MNIILLSGGSGKRLWPLSNDIRSKQFIKIFRNRVGRYESMLQRVYRQIVEIDPNASVTIAAPKTQVSAIHNHLQGEIDICIEPCRRDTFWAIVLAAAYLHYRKGISLEETVVVCPVDSYVEDEYFQILKEMGTLAASDESDLILLGVEPSYPSEKYGYIIPVDQKHVSRVCAFKEKPNKEAADWFIQQGALWNGGLFGFKLKYILKKAYELIEFKDYDSLFQMYHTLGAVSFDYAVVEKEKNMQVIRYKGQWQDLGTWNTLTEAMAEPCIGKSVLSDKCENVHVINSLDIPVLCIGLKNIVVSAGPDGILVSDKEESSYMKPYVEQLDMPVRYAEKSWGSYQVLDIGAESLTLKLILNPNMQLNYHSHEQQDESWIVILGRGWVIIDGQKKKIGIGDIITMRAGCKHTVIAETELHVIEIQVGQEISLNDIYEMKI